MKRDREGNFRIMKEGGWYALKRRKTAMEAVRARRKNLLRKVQIHVEKRNK